MEKSRIMDEKNNRKVFALVGIILLVILAIIVDLFFFKSDKNVSSDVILKENVHIITKETEEQPIKVSENKLVFDDKVPYKEGDVIVSGITDAAPSGYIRKVIEVYKEDEQYTLVTENGVLTDVFEKAHIEKRFVFTAEGLQEVDNENLEQAYHWNGTIVGTKFLNNWTSSILAKSIPLSSEKETEYLFSYKFDEAIDGGMSAEGIVGFNIWLEVKLDIEDDEVTFGLIAHDEYGGEITIGWNAEAEKEYTKKLLSKNLPNLEFFVGTVPIVMTNELEATLDLTGTLEGTLGTTYELNSENEVGFLYESKSGQVQEISEHSYLSEGLEFETKAEAVGEVSGGVNIHLVAKLYDCTGADIALGIVGEVEGKVGVNYGNDSDEVEYVGSLDMSVKPKLQGELIVTVPVIDKKLAEKTLFEEELEPFWEKHWEYLKENDEEDEIEVSAGLNNTYTTKDNSLPIFSFNYPDNWTIKKEEINVETEYEWVILSNDRGAEVTYYSSTIGFGSQYYGGGSMYSAHITKVADSSFVPSSFNGKDYSSLGKFVVAKIKVYAYDDESTGGLQIEVDGGTYYAVIPESYLGDSTFKLVDPACAWEYIKPIFVVAKAPAGEFTAEEEEEVIAILSSFTEVAH